MPWMCNCWWKGQWEMRRIWLCNHTVIFTLHKTLSPEPPPRAIRRNRRNTLSRATELSQTARIKIRPHCFQHHIHNQDSSCSPWSATMEWKKRREDVQTEMKMAIIHTHTHTVTESADPDYAVSQAVSPRRCPWPLTSLCWEADVLKASVAQDVEVVVRLVIVIVPLLSAGASSCSFCLDAACRDGRNPEPPFLLSTGHSPEATFCRTNSEKFLLKTNKWQSM